MTRAHDILGKDLSYLSDGGLETTLVFHDAIDLPHFAAFVLLRNAAGRAHLRRYFERYLRIAAERGAGFVLESPTWRANPDWGDRLGLSGRELRAVNRAAIDLMQDLRVEYRSSTSPILVSGNVGPRGDGYAPGSLMTPEQAEAYHAEQIAVLRDAGADLVSAFTLTNASEAIGFARAAHAAKIRAVVSFTVETDGRLPTGQSLEAAIREVDLETDASPAYYMLNCAHPTHFEHVLEAGSGWGERIRGVRANASRRSHQELDSSIDLDAGDPAELGVAYRSLLAAHPHLRVFGGCCGTDHRHVASIGAACLLAA